MRRFFLRDSFAIFALRFFAASVFLFDVERRGTGCCSRILEGDDFADELDPGLRIQRLELPLEIDVRALQEDTSRISVARMTK
ncbi:MAG TPA: hypothetical protein VE974_23750 [Thermoanaerobaculia bacterium]|nr:hypothetical protein [Thermoanaerobaculia bacterium]